VATVPCVISIDGAPPRALARDAQLEILESASFVRYLAVRGGFDVPRVLGSASTFLAGGFGGLQGRALARGDVLGIGAASHGSTATGDEAPTPEEAPLLVVPGPHADRFGPSARDALCAGVFQVGAKSRVGTRLTGGSIPRDRADDAAPEPMVPGAIQIATDGTPMILGPDAATTGGYPVLGVLDRASLWRLGRARPGASVRFVFVPGG
jgi:allophanate hydrolase subunit 2